MGDPSGVGPEILVRAAAAGFIRPSRHIVFGDVRFLEFLRKRLPSVHPRGSFQFYSTSPSGPLMSPPPKRLSRHAIPVIDFGNVRCRGFRFGQKRAIYGKASGDYIASAVRMCSAGLLDGMVTLPIHKESFRLGGWGKKFVGHTEMVTVLSRSANTGLMMVAGSMRVLHVTSHLPLSNVPRSISERRVTNAIDLAHRGLRDFGFSRPRIAVSGLNPHAGENGLLGREEIRHIVPAVRQCRRRGMRVSGPIPADVLWPLLRAGKFDVGIAMYHDQGQIPIKLAAVREEKSGRMSFGGVNVTLGLPFVRTSVAHGTAFDIAGKNKVSIESFRQALRLAETMVRSRRRGGSR